MRYGVFAVLLLTVSYTAAAKSECSCVLSDIIRFLAEALTYTAVAFMVLSALVYFVERGRVGKEGAEATGADSVKTMMLFLRDLLSTLVFLTYLVFLFSCLYFAADYAARVLLPQASDLVGNKMIPALLTDWTARIIAIVVVPVFLWLLVEGKIRLPKAARFLLGAFSPTNKFSSTVIAPLAMLSGILFSSWSNAGGPIPWTLFLAAALLVIQMLVLKELLRLNHENKLTNHIVAAANLSPMMLGAVILGSGLLACGC